MITFISSMDRIFNGRIYYFVNKLLNIMYVKANKCIFFKIFKKYHTFLM